MRNHFLIALLAATTAFHAGGATLPIYINNGFTNNPQIDATAVLNTGVLNASTTLPFDTANTLYYTNTVSGQMIGSTGFRLEFITNSIRGPAANVVNRGLISGSGQVIINATNITNSGTLVAGPQGLVRMTGKNVNVNRGGLAAGGSASPPYARGFTGFDFINVTGVTDLYWGSGSNNVLDVTTGPRNVLLAGLFNLPFVRSPLHEVEFASYPIYATNRVSVGGGRTYTAYMLYTVQTPRRDSVQVVFVPTDTDPALVTDVRFIPDSTAVVQFAVPDVDISTAQPMTNFIYLIDNTAFFGTNYGLSTNLIQPTYRPQALEITRSTPFEWDFGTVGNMIYTNGLLDAGYLSNRGAMTYHAYSCQVGGGYAFGGSLLTDPTNSPGRVEIVGDQVDLTRTRIRSDSFLSVRATNVSSTSNMVFDAPFINYNLVSSNRTLTVDALLKDSVLRLSGSISSWSAFWTNAFVTALGTNAVTNIREFSVMVIDHNLTAIQDVSYGDVYFKATDVVIGDRISPVKTFVADAESFTVNTGGSLSFGGDVGLAEFPRLQSLTNDGFIFLGGVLRLGTDRPAALSNIVNRGTIAGWSIETRSRFLENSGTLDSFFGPLSALFGSASITNASLFAQSDIHLVGASLDVSNSFFQSSAALLLDVTNHLSDGGTSSSNFWSVNDGFQFLTKPATGDLLGTTLTSFAPQFGAVTHVSAGADRGADVSGYTDNLAIGKLVLDGGAGSVFVFTGRALSNALYVDFIEFDNNATNYLDSLQIDPNITVYFADSNLPAEKLDGLQGGRLRWVRSYAGSFSSVTVTNADLSTSVVNRALRFSSTIDSDADGIPNAFDAFPFDPVAISLTTAAAAPGLAGGGSPSFALISWEAAADTTYRVECQKSLAGRWEFVRNYTHGPVNSTATVSDPITTNGACFYRVIYYR